MFTLLHAWVLVPLALAGVGAGWGVLVERAAGARVKDQLLIPLGLAAAIVVAGTVTAFSGVAKAAIPLVVAGAVAGLIRDWPGARLLRWSTLGALGVVLAYGAPVIFSGQATFTGFIRLDDTSTWFNIVDHVFSHGRSVSEPASTYSLVYTGDVGRTYPVGAFMLPGIARWLARLDVAWAFQPYLACCAAAVALALDAMLEATVRAPRVRALLAFGGAQAALLYGYSLWGGVKELTAAFLLALGVALASAMIAKRPARAREMVPLAVAAGALIQTLGVGAAAWVVPAVAVLLGSWIYTRERRDGLAPSLRSLASLAGACALFVVPIWIVIGDTLSSSGGGTTFETLFSSGQSAAVKFGNLIQPLSVFQLAGIWPIGDFRLTAPTLSSALWIGSVILAATGAIVVTLRRREVAIATYVGVALAGCGIVYVSGGTPWVVGKSLAICSPAILTAALAGAGALWSRWGQRRAHALGGVALAAVLLGGVEYSNALGYGDATLAPRAPLAELEHIGGMLAGHGPTFVNTYEIYADRHFLRAGAPVEPAEYRTATLPLRSGAILTKSAAADLDSFPLSVIEQYPSIVTPSTPAESRPPSNYRLAWHGRYYDLWQRSAESTRTILEHLALGESRAHPYCGESQNQRFAPLCSLNPAATPTCARIRALASRALLDGADLVAYERPEPIALRGDDVLWPGAWDHDPEGHTLTPTAPGEAVSHIAVASEQVYELWLGGSFSRGFSVRVDGREAGSVKDVLFAFKGYAHVADVHLAPGVHTFSFTYPRPNLTPGSAENALTTLAAITLVPTEPESRLVTLTPEAAERLCGRSLDWIEIVRGA
jgi:hypothetical protein